MKDHWNVLVGHKLTLDPMGKCSNAFFSETTNMIKASYLKPLGQLKPNCPGMIIGRSSTEYLFYMAIGNPRWPPSQYID
jgi:hypothetical protein